MKLILASKSPRRIELLTQAGYKFEIIPAQKDEKTAYKTPHRMVKDLALKKAFEVAAKYPASTVVGADTLVYCKGRVIGKPKDKADALKILHLLNNSWQTVYTGVAIVNINKKKLFTGYAATKCKARKLSDTELKLISGKHMDKAGAYAMQDKDDMLIERVEGSLTNVIGMPMELFNKMIKEFGF
ncbi:Nucleotide-binding protein implicated in inhibition of septum formation [Elusimicrobium minutum Pei191]|uniref:dTTP/UTP pyrophosphatase n=1 Tax=Elusimicrobium minutum (strain Pei191) TaxID=445932 RepID=NTPPA_ELUMP|nr:Maf family protein [Elusimicrobium minutum]B2KC30.1 RecName: Full=dTTP/UTP pyrophosphatase; Short=dTTPase/UTPase; AltName: Full=Nucleoside triphosphate pyrophosphatase; AltName: Full=Nucleotide pyrophosphatase; Short=Nucleotide PPase [Elusimicrobium minutum Pei191]ACC98157.1 Nucleotide-binding protein implicated in inhibition of septum formation [Elusimicrobium minutum Pei191]